MVDTRKEHDLIGYREVPGDRYYGIQTLRALENYDITALNPIIGYEKSTEIANEAIITNRSVYQIVLGKGYLNKDDG